MNRSECWKWDKETDVITKSYVDLMPHLCRPHWLHGHSCFTWSSVWSDKQQMQSENVHLTKAQQCVPFSAFDMHMIAELSVDPQHSYTFMVQWNELIEIKKIDQICPGSNMSWWAQLYQHHATVHTSNLLGKHLSFSSLAKSSFRKKKCGHKMPAQKVEPTTV